jgi:hypothetical protein
MRMLMAGRRAGSARRRSGPRWHGRIGFVVLERTDAGRSGVLGRPWPRGGRAPRLADQRTWRRLAWHDEPGWPMIANFRVGGGELTTETRVLATDERSRRAFARYWLLIRPFSGLIRRLWLAAIVRRATRTGRSDAD